MPLVVAALYISGLQLCFLDPFCCETRPTVVRRCPPPPPHPHPPAAALSTECRLYPFYKAFTTHLFQQEIGFSAVVYC